EYPGGQAGSPGGDSDHPGGVGAAAPAAALLGIGDRVPTQAAAEVAPVELPGPVVEPIVGGLRALQLALDAASHALDAALALEVGHRLRDQHLEHPREQARLHRPAPPA